MIFLKSLLNPLGFGKSLMLANRSVRRLISLLGMPNDKNCCKYSNGVPESFKTEDYIDSLKKENKAEEKTLEKHEIFLELANGNSNTMKQLKLLDFEIAVLREEGERVPQSLTKDDWLELINEENIEVRKKFLANRRSVELSKLSDKERKAFFKEKLLKKLSTLGDRHYAFGGFTLFFIKHEYLINRLLNYRLLKAKRKVIFDCSYQDYMNIGSIRACARQLGRCIHCVKMHPLSCMIEFSNFNRDDLLGQTFPKYLPKIYESVFPFHTKSHVEIYPKQRLVYLTPDSTNTLETIKDNDIFIIGGYVNKTSSGNIPMVKATQDGLRTAKLPYDNYLYWKTGKKNLPINIVFHIMMDMFYYNSWITAFRHVPYKFIHDCGSVRKWKILKSVGELPEEEEETEELT